MRFASEGIPEGNTSEWKNALDKTSGNGSNPFLPDSPMHNSRINYLTEAQQLLPRKAHEQQERKLVDVLSRSMDTPVSSPVTSLDTGSRRHGVAVLSPAVVQAVDHQQNLATGSSSNNERVTSREAATTEPDNVAENQSSLKGVVVGFRPANKTSVPAEDLKFASGHSTFKNPVYPKNTGEQPEPATHRRVVQLKVGPRKKARTEKNPRRSPYILRSSRKEAQHGE